LVKRFVLPPYNSFELSTFAICGKMVYISHFAGLLDKNGKVLSTIAS